MIKIENLCKSFRTEDVETIALNNVSFTVEDGEFVAIMGPRGRSNGSPPKVLTGNFGPRAFILFLVEFPSSFYPFKDGQSNLSDE